MADTPTGAFEKKVLIALESTMSGVQDTLRALESMRKHLGHAEVSTKATDKATAALSRTYSKASKDINKLKKGFKGLKEVQKGLYETMRGIGNITRTALGTATVAAGAFIAETKRIGDTMLRFETTSLNASKALNTLGSAYGSLRAQSNSAILSMQDVAAELTKFQSQGIAQMSATMKKEFEAGWIGVQSVLTQVLGKSRASEAMGSFVQSLGDEFKFLRKTIGQDLGVIAQRIQNAVDPQIKVQALDEAIAKMRELRIYTNDQGTAAQMVIGQMTKLRDVTLGGGSDITKGVIAINVAWAKFGTVVENVSTQLVATFGPDLAAMIRGLGGWLDNNVTRVVDRLIQKAKELHARFVEWGGTEQLIQSLTRALDAVWQTLSKIVSMGASLIGWITEANASTQILVGSMAAIALAPGLLMGVSALAKGLYLVSIQGAAAAAASMSGLAGVGAAVASRAAGVGLVGGAATLGHLGGKAIGGYAGLDEGGLGEALAGAAGAAATGAIIGSVIPGIGTAVGAAIGGVGSLVVSAIGAWGDDTADIIKQLPTPQVPDATARKIKQLQEKIEQLESEKIGYIAQELKNVSAEAEKAEDKFAEFISKLEDIKAFANRTLPGFTAAVGGMVAVIETLGPVTEYFGEKMSDIVQRITIDEMAHSFLALRESVELAAIASEKIQLAKLADDPKLAAEWIIKLGDAMTKAEQATRTLQQSLEAGLQPLKTQLKMISAIKDLRQLDLDISQQLYGTPALAVQAQLELVRAMQMQKENLETQLAFTQSRIANADALKLTEKDIFFLRMKELDLSKEIRSVTAQQLTQVKQLRDGYIDAVQQMALGAGRFQKILITQEQSLGRGLLKGAVKPNFLLGQAGAAAGASRADPYRFSAQGMGFLETLSGQIMSPQDVTKAVYERVANISDPLAKASALQSADIFMNIMSGAEKNTKNLGNIFMLGMTQNADRIVDAIGGYAEQRLPRAAAGLALKGAPAGETLFGAARDRYGRGLTLPPPETGVGGLPFDPAAYRRQIQQQGASQDSIRALTEHYGNARTGARYIKSASGPLTPVESPEVVALLDTVKKFEAATKKEVDAKMSQWRIDRIPKYSDFDIEHYARRKDEAVVRQQEAVEAQQKIKATADPEMKKLLNDLASKSGTYYEAMHGAERTRKGYDIKNLERYLTVPRIKHFRSSENEAPFGAGPIQSKIRPLKDIPLTKNQLASVKEHDEAIMSAKTKMDASSAALVAAIKQGKIKPESLESKTKPADSKKQAKIIEDVTRGHPALRGIPTLTAVDTDEFMGKKRRRDPVRELQQKLQAKYGRRAGWMARTIKVLSKIDENLKKINAQIIPDSDDEEIMGPPTKKQDRERRLQARLRHRKKVLEKARKKRLDDLQKSREAVDKPRREQARLRQQQVAAEAALGLGYTGDAPGRVEVDETGRPIRRSKGGKRLVPNVPDWPDFPFKPQPDWPDFPFISPGIVRGKQAPIRERVGVGNPTRIRQLAHGVSGNVHVKGRKVRQLMQQAGQLVEEISQDVDALQEDQDNITQYAGNRNHNVQPISP